MLVDRVSLSFALMLACVSGCSTTTTTDPLLSDLRQHQDAWDARKLTTYSYDYEQTGFFSAIDGRVIHLQVKANVVTSAVFKDTGAPAPGDPSGFPTIDGLFAQAETAAVNGDLTAVTYDSAYGYPSRIDISGVPDASGSIFASQLQSMLD